MEEKKSFYFSYKKKPKKAFILGLYNLYQQCISLFVPTPNDRIEPWALLSSLLAGGDAGGVQVTRTPGHGAPRSTAVLTRGPLIAGSAGIPTGQ